MYVQQQHSIRFFIRRNKLTKDGKAPVYARLTIDGLQRERVVKGVKILPDHWDPEYGLVKTDAPKARTLNKKIAQVQTDLQRHFDLVQVAQEVATPQSVLRAYDSPLQAAKTKDEQRRNFELSETLDELIRDYIIYGKGYKKAHANGRSVPLLQAERLAGKEEAIKKRFDQLIKKGNGIFDDKHWEKTIGLAIDENLIHFMELAWVGDRSVNTLEKMWGRKKRYIAFLQHRYDVIDLPLAKLEFRFMDQLLTYNITQHRMIRNSSMKYVQGFKEIVERTVANGWLPANIFSSFMCHYEEPQHDWLTPAEMDRLLEAKFEIEKYHMIRDIYVFSSFTGLSYAEIHSLCPADIITGIDGKKWLTKDRQKTGSEETVPLLPIPLFLIERYNNNPVCLKRGKVFPVPSNVEYNRCLKEIAKAEGIKIILRTHKARFYFANEVLFNNGVQLKTVARMMGQKSIKSAEMYVRANRTVVSEAMQEVQDKLFNPDGSLKSKRQVTEKAVPFVGMRAV